MRTSSGRGLVSSNVHASTDLEARIQCPSVSASGRPVHYHCSVPIELHPSSHMVRDPAAQDLFDFFENEQVNLGLDHAIVYHGYPRFRDEDDELLVASVLVLSPNHGLLLFGTLTGPTRDEGSWRTRDSQTEALFGRLYGKMIANKNLRKSPRQLSITAEAYVYGETTDDNAADGMTLEVLRGHGDVRSKLIELHGAVSETLFAELVALVDGSRSIPRPKKRDASSLSSNSKGGLAGKLESELARFDKKQRQGSVTDISGPQRIRGLAGSGKTIVLAKKAALTHLDDPTAQIAYTFHTKSLYQQIRRLVTRFYRDEHDQDVDWNVVSVLHSWGGVADAGIYSLACKAHGVPALRYPEAATMNGRDAFDNACSDLLEKAPVIQSMYDFIFIDEGQDFPPSFLKLCAQLARDMKFVYAYDELQTIFRPTAPTPAEVFGTDKTGQPKVRFQSDVVLYKCYRNPLEILVCAHAVGFGLYSKSAPVQMLENAEHWQDIGYEIESGDLVEGQEVVIKRPKEHSLSLISDGQDISQIVQAQAFDEYEQEIAYVAKSIAADLKDGLRADDVVVAVVDDRNAKQYLQDIANALSARGIAANNIHSASGIVDFLVEDRVTLTTVHKAKGNEGFVVYVVGADAPFASPNRSNRNKIFTAMTRAKGWVRVSGLGDSAKELCRELEKAKKNCPRLCFRYPSDKTLKLMKRDLNEDAVLDAKAERLLDNVSDKELEAYLARRRGAKKRKK
jgi:superfamily I DNA and RNA helicase